MYNQSGFSTILALLLTGFLVTLAAGVLFLFLSENRINQSLLTGTAAYHVAEGSLEYALLKIKNHREGFADTLIFGGKPGEDTDTYEGNRIGEGRWPKAPRMGYEIISGGSSYTGTIVAGDFAVIPLFREKWAIIATQSGKDLKNPKKSVESPFYNYDWLTGVVVNITSGGGLTWNVIGNKPNGDSFGISGKLVGSSIWTAPPSLTGCIATQCAPPATVLSATTIWDFREYEDGVLSQTTKNIGSFLGEYKENYLILYNAQSASVSYGITAPNGQEFTFPATLIKASGKVRDSLVRLELSETKSSIYDILKYSLFVK